MSKTIIVTGSVCSGKTTLAKKLAESLGYTYLDINQVIKEHNLCEERDIDRECIVIDEQRLAKVLEKVIEGSKDSLVMDSHLAHYLSSRIIDLCIVTKCGLKELEKRLKERKYKPAKLQENLQAEIFDVCLLEAKDLKHNTLVIDTTDGITQKDLVKIKQALK